MRSDQSDSTASPSLQLPGGSVISERAKSPFELSGRSSELLLGLVFLASAAVKFYEPFGFRVQLSHYGLPKDTPLLSWLVVAVPLIELGLAGLLLSGLMLRRMTLWFTTGLLVVFSSAIVYGWSFHGLEECGCFGEFLKLTPGLSLLRNGVMLGLAGLALVARTRQASAGIPEQFRRLWGSPVRMFSAVMLPLAVGFGAFAAGQHSQGQKSNGPAFESSGSLDAASDARPFAEFHFEGPQGPVDLGSGAYFVALLSMSCDHCAASVPHLNEFPKFFPDMPSIIGLCLGDEGSLADFRERTGPNFPLYLISPLRFFELIGRAPPRFSLVVNGKVRVHWDGELPDDQELLKVLDAL